MTNLTALTSDAVYTNWALDPARQPGDTTVIQDTEAEGYQILYFVDMDIPVLAYTGEGRSVVLTAYDQSHVTFYDPISGNTERMETSQADAYFSGLGNDYVCRIPAE